MNARIGPSCGFNQLTDQLRILVLKFNETLFASETLADFAAKIQVQGFWLTSLPVSLENDKYWQALC
ncbi:MAG: hypothetical protein IH820_01970 [Bacteroidetes bacterium]|nr:hypothetical protein [Bacteroidota bacterium]